MCEHPYNYPSLPPEAPEVALARLIKRELGADIDSKALPLFLRHKWSRVTALAHKIHDSDGC